MPCTLLLRDTGKRRGSWKEIGSYETIQDALTAIGRKDLRGRVVTIKVKAGAA